jgi:subfamily B ATP-binding cassette protein MsbA
MIMTYIFLAFLANFQFAFLVVLSSALTNLFYRKIHRKIKGASLEISKKGHNLNAYMIEVVHHFKYLKSTDYLKRFSDRVKEVIKQTQSINKKTGTYSALLAGLREPVVVCIVVLVIFMQVNWVGGELGSIILSLLLFYRALNILMTIQTEWQGFLNNHGSMRTVAEVSDVMSSMKEMQGENTFSSFKSEISLENISLTYTDNPVLTDVNVRLPKNETIAFVGVSGSGKTTLVNIISGLLKPNTGSIFIDGTPLDSYNLNSYRSKIGYISQESVIFNDTIYNNITFWDPPTPENEERFWKAIHLASLQDFVHAQIKKEHTRLGDNGILISGGQRQRISIARELYKEPEILLLDEATSALDSETELVIQENLERLHGSYTMVIIAHRLSTIKNADVIYLLDKGEISCHGDFDSMVEKSSKFKNMVSLQGL